MAESFAIFMAGAGVAIAICTIWSKRDHDAAMKLVDDAMRMAEKLAARVEELEATNDADWWKNENP